MKKLMIALASATVLLASSAMAQEKLKIGAAPYGLNAEFMQIWSAALEEHPAVKNGEVELTVFDGRYDALVQQEQFNTMITQKFNAIIFVPFHIEAGATAVQAAGATACRDRQGLAADADRMRSRPDCARPRQS